MDFELKFTSNAEKDLSKVVDPYRKKILVKVNSLSKGLKNLDVKKIRSQNKFRLRVGYYRIIFEVIYSNNLIVILEIKHRKDIYKKR